MSAPLQDLQHQYYDGQQSNESVYDGSVSFANSAAAGTAVSIDIALPAILQRDSRYLVTVTNPSAESDLTVKVRGKETLGATARYPELTSFAVGKSLPDGKSVVVQGWMLGEAGRLVITNDTALGVAGAFTAYIRVRKA